jgi:hypothetical protein
MTDEEIALEKKRLALLDFAYASSDAKNNGEAIAWLNDNWTQVDPVNH